MAVGDHQVAATHVHWQFRQQLCAGMAGRHQHLAAQHAAVVKLHPTIDQPQRAPAQYRRARGAAARHQPVHCARRVQHAFAGHQHAAGQPRGKHRLEFAQPGGVHGLGVHARGLQARDLGRDRGHLAVVRRHPQRPAAAVFGLFQAFERVPQPHRIAAQGQFGRVVVHRHQVPHRRGRDPAPGDAGLDDRHPAAVGQRPLGAAGADDPGADDDEVVAAHSGHSVPRMPQANGSSASMRISARPVIHARPVMRGSTPRPPAR